MRQFIFILLYPTSRPNTDEADCLFKMFVEEHKELLQTPVWATMLLEYNLRAKEYSTPEYSYNPAITTYDHQLSSNIFLLCAVI